MKRIIIIICAALLLGGICAVFPAAEPGAAEDGYTAEPTTAEASDYNEELVPASSGDTDGSGRITAADARLALRIAARIDRPDAETLSRADIDRSGKVDSVDARIILRVAAKLQAAPNGDEPVTLPPPPPVTQAPAPPADDRPAAMPREQLARMQNRDSYYNAGDRGLLTPYRDHGLGQTRMCEVLMYRQETYDAADRTDKSNILCTPLAKGTFEYVTGEQVYNGNKTYVLSCGRKVDAKDARLIPAGYRMPTNRLEAGEIVRGWNTTDFYLKPLWAVPAQISVGPQAYFTGYLDRAFNVASFTAQYVDVTFYHTSAFSGAFPLRDGDPFSSVECIPGWGETLTLRFRLKKTGGFRGCTVDLTEEGMFRISVKNVGLPTKTVVIDAGHGGNDPGARGALSGIYEGAINLAIAQKTAEQLRAKGIKVVTVRTGDETHSLDERVLYSRFFRPDAYVSIHSDYDDHAAARGTHAFYYYPWSMPLAESVHRHMLAAYREKIYAPGSSGYARADRGVHFYPFRVTRVEECPSILVECGFVSNPEECGVLTTPAYQQILAGSIADGIVEYLNAG